MQKGRLLPNSLQQSIIQFVPAAACRSQAMTVKETLDQILDHLPEEDQQQLLEFAAFLRWRQEQAAQPGNGLEAHEDLQAAQKAAAFSLPNAKLKALASKHKPPQTWYDENDKPF